MAGSPTKPSGAGLVGWLRVLAAVGLCCALAVLAGCEGGEGSDGAADEVRTTGSRDTGHNRSTPVPPEPSGFTGSFSTMDERQRCKATDAVVVCASTESGQRVRLDRSGASYEGEVAVGYPAAAPLGAGKRVETASGIRCLNSDRGIECSRGGHGFVIGDSAVSILRGQHEERYEATTDPVADSQEPAPAPEPAPTEAEEPTADSGGQESGQFCWPGLEIPPTRVPAVHIPATRIPATDIGGVHYPAQDYPAIDYPAQTLPGVTLPPSCFDSSSSYLPPAGTSVLVSDYDQLDPEFSEELSSAYWDSAPAPDYLEPGFTAASVPDVTATGFGELNEAGFPKNQFVRGYFRRDGNYVDPYWRNSSSDGRPTCRIISC